MEEMEEITPEELAVYIKENEREIQNDVEVEEGE